MKIKSIRLINFSSILACRNLTEVYYEFDDNGKTINQICGPNRSGKTVLIQQLHPFSSINLNGDERSDLQLIIPGETGVKEITYEVDGKEYHINHTYKPSGKSHSVISSIVCDGKELNSSGGVNTFNSVIEKVFGLNRYAFQFTINGTQLNSLSTMNATQRKALLNKALGVDIYDKIHKLSTADHRYISKTISSLNNTKEFILKKYGSYENLQMMLSEKQKEYTSLINSMSSVKSNMDRLFGMITSIKNQDPYNELQRLNMILEDVIEVSKRIGSYDDSTYIRLSEESIELNKKLEQLKTKYHDLLVEMDKFDEKKDDIVASMAKAKRMKDDYDDMKRVKERLEEQIKSIKVNKIISLAPDFYRAALNLTQTINSMASEIVTTLNDDLLDMVVKMVLDNVDIPAFLIREGAVLNDGEKERNAMNRLNVILSSVPGEYPKCNHENCIYKNTYDKFQVYFKSYQSATKSKLTIDDLENIDHCWKNITSIKRLINTEYPDELKNTFNIETIMLNIKSSKWGVDFDYVKSLYEAAVDNEQRRKLIEQLQNVENNIKMIESVMIDDTDPTQAINDINKHLDELGDKREMMLREKVELEGAILANDKNRALISHLNGVNVGEVHAKIDKLTETIKTLDQLQQTHDEHYRTYHEYASQQSELSIQLDSLKKDDSHCKMTMNELMTNKEQDTQCRLISDATSSTKGLPVVLIHNTLDESVKIANHLLDVIYDGSVHLNDVEVSESALNIPFTHDLITSNDIRYGSQSESTIFALVLSLALSTQLTNYNIILIDEIDAYLDHDFKDKFVLMLDEVSRLLHIDQLFMISHNINTEQFSNIINRINLI